MTETNLETTCMPTNRRIVKFVTEFSHFGIFRNKANKKDYIYIYTQKCHNVFRVYTSIFVTKEIRIIPLCL